MKSVVQASGVADTNKVTFTIIGHEIVAGDTLIAKGFSSLDFKAGPLTVSLVSGNDVTVNAPVASDYTVGNKNADPLVTVGYVNQNTTTLYLSLIHI